MKKFVLAAAFAVSTFALAGVASADVGAGLIGNTVTLTGPDGAVTGDHNPNGSQRNIAGIYNKRGTILGMMPHPEDAVDSLLGGIGGKPLFDGLTGALGTAA